ncbi:SDR family oxidoreductase [Serratia sp. M24T3]|uniref:SDR family NAD(P)-dependent oxidoreductase n=1 Tax=Serratia sp. M24T3 TaxID=932213 RepID=UPI00025B8E05|nr:SDR family oxidoreductase [Serratia sp. M24T3]EIC86387.1 3-oxoacyl-ACP reductase [Serratia sp. M24T3]
MTQQVALITGASRGIGRQVAQYFAEQGYSLILLARDENLLNAVAASLPVGAGQQVQIIATDLCAANEVERKVNTALAAFPQLNVLVNAAGIFRPGSSQATLGDFSAMLDTNVAAVHHLCQLCIPALARSKQGRIFNLSSVSGVQAFGGIAGYAASKHALVGYSLSLGRELASQGIKVTVLCPDVVDTEMAQGSGLAAHEMLETADICRAIDFIMSLSPAAMVEQLTIGRMRK